MRGIVLFGVAGSGKDTIGNLLVERSHFGETQPAWRKEAFANPLKEMVKHAFGFSDDDLYGPSKNRWNQYKQYPFAQGRCMSCGMDPERCDDQGGYWQLCDSKGVRSVKGQEENADHVRCVLCHMVYPRYINPRIALQTLGTEWGRGLFSTVWVDAAFRRIEDSVERVYPPNTPNWVITDGRFFNELKRSQELGAKGVLLLRKLEDPGSSHPSETELRTIPREEFDYVLDNRGELKELPRLLDQMLKDLDIRV
jgi:hypothetical protein